jgi:type IV secretion system protein TrbJ
MSTHLSPNSFVRSMTMKKHFNYAVAISILSVGLVQNASAQWAVFDAANFAKNTITAAEQVKTEVYQDTNVAYQYQMMFNQLKQATTLNPAAMLAQATTITNDIKNLSNYTNTLSQIYGGLQSNAQYLTKVESLITQSGKTPQQWLSDQGTLLESNDATAKQLFQQGNDITTHIQTLATRRQEIQNQLNLAPTQQATAQLTTHMLDIVASQNGDMLQMMAAKQQSDATDKSAQVANAKAANAAQTALQARLEQQTAAFQSQIAPQTTLGQ